MAARSASGTASIAQLRVALGHAGDEPNELVRLAIDGERVALRRDRAPVQIGRVQQHSARLIEIVFVIGQLKDVFTIAEIAEYYGVHVSTVIRWRQRGLFPNAKREPKREGGAQPASDLVGFVPPERGRSANTQRRSRQRRRGQTDAPHNSTDDQVD